MEEFNRKQKKLLIWTMVIAIAAYALGFINIVYGDELYGDESTPSLGIGCFGVGFLAMCIGLPVYLVRATRIYRVCKKAGVTGTTEDADLSIIQEKCREMGVEKNDAISFYTKSKQQATVFKAMLIMYAILAVIGGIVVSCAINGGDSGSGGSVCPSCGRTVSRLYGGMCKTCHDNFEWGMSALGQ